MVDKTPQESINQKISSIESLKTQFPDQFDKIGNLEGEAVLHLKDDAIPSIDAPRKCSIHLKDKLKKELDMMEEQKIIEKITHHTDWCSSITTTVKKNGDLRVCLDPKRLNQNLKRCPHKIPTVEELNPAFANAKFFSQLDAKSGYWSVHLAEESRDLTTFRTPFSRYRFLRLPFGLSVSQDIFQQHMDRIIAQVPGCVGIADDIAVFGATEAEHDANLIKLMETAKSEGLVFNSKKCLIKTKEIKFFGSIYTTTGIKPDPSKVEDIHAMPTPESKEDLQRFMGLMTYLSEYIPNFSSKSAPLRDLLKKGTPYIWQEDHQHCFEEVKKLVTADSCIQYFDPKKPTVLEVDASLKGLGACLLQHGKVVASASKSLTQAQSDYSNIERETLALAYGVTRFHMFLFGKEFTVESDHKPLEMIVRKPLNSAPPRLRKILTKVQGYTFDLKYKPGSQMVLSDTLSRLPNPKKINDVPLDILVESMDLEDSEHTQHMDLVNFGQSKRESLQKETSSDPVLRGLSQIIQEGWPDAIKELPKDMRPYWSYRDELGVANGVIFKGRQVLIPEVLRSDILEQLHHGHFGIEKTRRLARESVYWPKINQDIEQLTKKCETCQAHQPSHQKEPLEPHDIPTTPWTKLATDLFQLDGDDYLLMTDYHSKYPVLTKMTSTKSEMVAKAVSATFSLFGPPAIIVSDNGPQYVGKPFQDMCQRWSIDHHTTSSPRYPRSNGLIERTVRSIKALIKKCKATGQDIQIAMLHYRATPIDSNLPSPAEIMMGRPVRTTIPSYHHPSSLQKNSDTFENLQSKKDKMKQDHDKHAGPELAPLYKGQRVRVQNQVNKMWEPAEVTKVCAEPRSYEVTTPNGTMLRRNRSHISEMPSSMTTPRESDLTKITVPKRVNFTTDTKKPATNNHHNPRPPECTPGPDGEREPNIRTEKTALPQPDGQTVTRSGRVSRRPMRFRENP
jgi:transposase InsO family protein